MNAIDQMETLMIYSSRGLDDIPFRKRQHFNGSNHGNKIGDLSLPAFASLWHATKSEREKVLGDALKQIGGPTPGCETGRGHGAKKDVEPIWHMSMDPNFYKECASSYYLKRVINLTGSDGIFEMAMLSMKIPIVTVCLNEYHKSALKTRLEKQAMKHMCDSTHPAHEPALAALFAVEAPKPVPKPAPAPKPKPQPAPQPAAQPALPTPTPAPQPPQGDLLAQMQAKLAEIRAREGKGVSEEAE